MDKGIQRTTKVGEFEDERFEVLYRKLSPPEACEEKYPAPAPGEIIEDGIYYERDIAVTMRDGVVIYTDVYRPEGETNIPAIVAWSPYGKRGGYFGEGGIGGTGVPGVPPGTVSPMAKFEGPDPAYWCRYGYAVVNPDARGCGYSEGDLALWGSVEGRDIYDLIEWAASQDWCNSKVGMSGNSWLAMSQWTAVAEKPPHLTAIAPWEGISDYYRESICPGGIPETGFVSGMFNKLCGLNNVEDVPAMIQRHPLINNYWKDKVASVGAFEAIDIPAYVVASWTSIHTYGTIAGFRRISSKNKWLRVHNSHEWSDYYRPENLEDLRRFFDRYLKGIRNGWELTPPVRLSILDPGGQDQVNRPEKAFPLERTVYEKLYLDAATGTLSEAPLGRGSSARYQSDDKEAATFTIAFDQDTEITGYMKLRLWVEAEASDDMDLFVNIKKLAPLGNELPAKVLGFPFPGAPGWLRVSHRELDDERSTPAEPLHAHLREQRLGPGEIVPVEIGIWPLGMVWRKGEKLQVVIKGYHTSWMDMLGGDLPFFKFEVRNKGTHIIHTGGKFDSHLLVPVIPASAPKAVSA